MNLARCMALCDMEGHSMIEWLRQMANTRLGKAVFGLPVLSSAIPWTQRIVYGVKAGKDYAVYWAGQNDDPKLVKDMADLDEFLIKPKLKDIKRERGIQNDYKDVVGDEFIARMAPVEVYVLIHSPNKN